MEPESARRVVAAAVEPVSGTMEPHDPASIIRDLNELIEAIDRRLPQVQRAGEAAVANAAMRLRIEARNRIAELERRKGTAANRPI